MATIEFKMNNLTLHISGVSGYMDECTYTNLDPVDYIYKVSRIRDGLTVVYRFKANTTTTTPLEGFRRTKTDESNLTFLGATFPGT